MADQLNQQTHRHTTEFGRRIDPHCGNEPLPPLDQGNTSFNSNNTSTATPHQSTPSASLQTPSTSSTDAPYAREGLKTGATNLEQEHHHKTGAEIEKDLINSGKMPGAQEAGPEHRHPGEADEAGNKIHHRGVLGRMLHWEHQSMNADDP